MSYNGSGTFQINTTGQPVVTGTVISSTAFNALTADLATGLSTAITKDGQTATTARIPFAAGISSTLVTDSTSSSTGSIITSGGVGVAKAAYIGTTLNVAGLASFTATSAVLLAKGTTAQRPSPTSGMLRFNTTTTEFEGYNGTAWSSVGGAALSNDTSTATNVFPLFANATTGTATTLFTGNAFLLYKPSTGELQARVPVASNGIVVNSQSVATSYTIATGYSGTSAGPITIASGQSVTVSSGSRWVVL
jgi:hypothetical protein